VGGGGIGTLTGWLACILGCLVGLQQVRWQVVGQSVRASGSQGASGDGSHVGERIDCCGREAGVGAEGCLSLLDDIEDELLCVQGRVAGGELNGDGVAEVGSAAGARGAAHRGVAAVRRVQGPPVPEPADPLHAAAAWAGVRQQALVADACE
jgi:hypothetical protein